MNKKLLFVDDETWYIRPIIERLEYMKFDVTHCTSIGEAINEISNKDFDLAIVDLLVPFGSIQDKEKFNLKSEIPGIELIKLIKKESSLPLICYSVFDNNDIKQEISKLDCKLISKASKSDSLYDEIEKLLNNF